MTQTDREEKKTVRMPATKAPFSRSYFWSRRAVSRKSFAHIKWKDEVADLSVLSIFLGGKLDSFSGPRRQSWEKSDNDRNLLVNLRLDTRASTHAQHQLRTLLASYTAIVSHNGVSVFSRSDAAGGGWVYATQRWLGYIGNTALSTAAAAAYLQ